MQFKKRDEEWFDDAVATAKFSFFTGCVAGLASSFSMYKREAIMFDIFRIPGVNARIFKTGVCNIFFERCTSLNDFRVSCVGCI